MSESVMLCGKTHLQNELNDSDMDAVQKLMQLSDEENSNNNSNFSCKNKFIDYSVNQRLKVVNFKTWEKIEEIFGKEEEQGLVYRPKKKRRYRSLANIYMTTNPIISFRYDHERSMKV